MTELYILTINQQRKPIPYSFLCKYVLSVRILENYWELEHRQTNKFKASTFGSAILSPCQKPYFTADGSSFSLSYSPTILLFKNQTPRLTLWHKVWRSWPKNTKTTIRSGKSKDETLRDLNWTTLSLWSFCENRSRNIRQKILWQGSALTESNKQWERAAFCTIDTTLFLFVQGPDNPI